MTAAYHGISVKDGNLYTTHFPCLMCSKMIINSGIMEVVYTSDYPQNDVSFKIFEETGVKIRQYQLNPK